MLSRIQRIVKWFTSAQQFEHIKRSSQQWKFTCKHCNQTSSIWDIGGIRVASKGNPLTGIKCPHCKKYGREKLFKEDTGA